MGGLCRRGCVKRHGMPTFATSVKSRFGNWTRLKVAKKGVDTSAHGALVWHRDTEADIPLVTSHNISIVSEARPAQAGRAFCLPCGAYEIGSLACDVDTRDGSPVSDDVAKLSGDRIPARMDRPGSFPGCVG